ncbi:Glycerophosphoryl diester phosphodiesterase family protein [Prauserella aidingensis]|uniref:phosphatidylinositol-specific phospholipase C/glycerophosphodiester phosphodiesterase family protein n=1 Tax=Prauserella aidingensis TaxID=387890 RepID=UPI0020A28BE8|nr:phosphatidylinositol-specific phospholipase C/glycerophosphodiester phosphodiesterase family protein [Prauserella aidingensis]MCP2252165.1 Glycerophosphoryl diester phosphodiesterase family protein [Prauserella aidingensis]
MRPIRVTVTAALAAVLALVAPAAAGADPRPDLGKPLAQAHAHNDYEHDRPLLDALEHGFTSVEADVWAVGDELQVAHDSWELDPDRTLRSLYLDPLRDAVRGKSGVYPGWKGQFQLLVDIKSDGPRTWRLLEEQLAEYEGMLTRYRDGKVEPGAIQVVVSGNRPLDDMAAATERRSFYDGRSGDLGGDLPAELMPLVSDNWTNVFDWNGEGPMPADERARLRDMVARAHDAGQRLRFWATPDAAGEERAAVWTELRDAGVDHINTDDLAGLRDFLRS